MTNVKHREAIPCPPLPPGEGEGKRAKQSFELAAIGHGEHHHLELSVRHAR